MNNNIIGLRFDTTLPPEQCSQYMRELLRRLFTEAHITYDQILFPYADSLLLSERGAVAAFGTHALIWDIDAKTLAVCAARACGSRLAELRPRARELDCTASAVADFLAERNDDAESPEGVLPLGDIFPLGDFAALLSGSVRPFAIREHSRRFCSLAEHIDRLNGCGVHGTDGGSLLVSGDKETLERLYCSKTGGRI